MFSVYNITRYWSADKQKIVVISIIGDHLLTGNMSLKLWPMDGPASGDKPIRKFPAHGSELQYNMSLDNNHFITSATATQLELCLHEQPQVIANAVKRVGSLAIYHEPR